MKKENENIRIEDDLYQNVNGKWLEEAVIPNDFPITGGFIDLYFDVEKKLMDDLEKFSKKEKEHNLPILDDAVRLYLKAKDVEKRDADGIKPLLPLLDKINNIKNINEFNELNLELMKDDVHLPFVLDVMDNPLNTTEQALVVMDPQTILPDKTLYDKKLIKLLMMKMFKKMVKDLLKFTPLDKKTQKLYLNDTIKFDDLLRRKVKTQQENADYVKLINPMKLDEVNSYLNGFDLKGLFTKLYQDKTPEIIGCGNPTFVKEFKDILNEETFPLFIHWTYVWTLLEWAPALSKEISDTSNYYTNKLTGIKENPNIEKQAFRLVSSLYSEPLGIYYGRTYFGEEAKVDITNLTKKIIETYKLRVRENEFLAPETKAEAIKKLDAIRIKMGYPDNYDEFYDTLKVSEDDTFFTAMARIRRAKIERKFNDFLKPTDFGKWVMSGHTVNACYDPFKNDITFPAAILQKPFYSVNQSYEENLGGIGAVIGHEISHAFDNNGSHFDERGNLKDWWKEEDLKKFNELTEEMVKQYDGIPYHGGKVNGRLVVSENIADNGGMAVTLQIMKELDNANYQAYFINWAKIWCQKAKESYIKLLLTNDVHSPSELRANITPRNFIEWYQAFNVKETDKMYIPEDKRINIW